MTRKIPPQLSQLPYCTLFGPVLCARMKCIVCVLHNFLSKHLSSCFAFLLFYNHISCVNSYFCHLYYHESSNASDVPGLLFHAPCSRQDQLTLMESLCYHVIFFRISYIPFHCAGYLSYNSVGIDLYTVGSEFLIKLIRQLICDTSITLLLT